MCKFIAGIFILLVGFQTVKAQTSNSTEIETRIAAADTLAPLERNKVYQSTIISLMYSNTNKAIQLSQTGLERSTAENDTAAMAAFANFIGVGYFINSQVDSSISILQKSILWAKAAGDEKRATLSYFALANNYSKAGMPDSAINCFYAVLPYFEKQNDFKAIGTTIVNIAVLYYNMGHHDKAKQHYTEAFAYAQKTNDHTLNGYTNRGVGLYETDYKQRNEYYRKALEEFRMAGNKFEESATLATIGWDFYTTQNNTPKALEYEHKALKIAEAHGFGTLIADQSAQLTDIYISLKDIPKAEYYAAKANEFAEKENHILMQRLEDKLFKLYVLKGDADKADSLYNCRVERITLQNQERMLNALTETEVKYETEKKELRINLLEKQRRLTLLLSILGGVLIIILLVLFATSYKFLSQKRKMAEQKIVQLEQEKMLIAAQSLLEGETAERTRLSKDLHDGLGGLLSVAKHKIATMKGSLTIPEEQVGTFNSALEMLDNSIKELRRVAHNLMPESLVRYGLNSAISDFCNSIDKAMYHFYGTEKRFDEKLEVAVFRIVSELVNNALKHANASKINVQLVQEQDRISITVYDDGCGFDAKSIDMSKAGGLNNVQSRVISFNGRIDILSSPEKGTEISVEFNC